jgi:hypothetical protein
LLKNLQEHVVQGNRANTDVLLYYTTTGRSLLNNLQEHVVQGNRNNIDVLLYYGTPPQVDPYSRTYRNMWFRGTGKPQTSCSFIPQQVDPYSRIYRNLWCRGTGTTQMSCSTTTIKGERHHAEVN